MVRLGRFLSLVLIGFAGLAFAGTDVNPCSEAGKAQIQALNHFSKPAAGGADEMDSEQAPEKRIAPMDDVNIHADQCRAVLGPIPKFDCRKAARVPIYLQDKEIEYRAGGIWWNGVRTDWKEITQCDHPSMLSYLTMRVPGEHNADPLEGCFPNSHMGVVHTSKNVDWVYDCHFRKELTEPDDNDHFSLSAFIGSNHQTGETCFFAHVDGARYNEEITFYNGSQVPVPGGAGPADVGGRRAAKDFWKTPGKMSCLRCHAFNSPWMVSPHLYQSAVNGDGSHDFIPSVPRSKMTTPQWGFRVIGSVHNQIWPYPKAIFPKNDDGTEDHTCTRCHMLPNQVEGLRLTRVAVGLPELTQNLKFVEGFVRDLKPWMPPSNDGSDEELAEHSRQAVLRYQRAFYDPKFRAREAEIISACPKPADLSTSALQAQAGRVSWTYANDYGAVPMRDDVRFQVEISGSDGSSCAFRDVSPKQIGSSEWEFRHPTVSGVKYRYQVPPYRYCFDRTDLQYGARTAAE